MKKLSAFTLLLLCLLFLTRCNTQDSQPDPNAPTDKLSSVFISDFGIGYSFKYNSNRLDKIVMDLNGFSSLTLKVNYRTDGKIQNIVLDPPNSLLKYQYDYTYNSKNQLASIDWNMNGVQMSFLYTYDANGRVMKVEEVTESPMNNEQIQVEYTLTYDNKGNVTRQTLKPQSPGEPDMEIMSEYDNAYNYFKPLQLPPYLLAIPFLSTSTPNNLTKISVRDLSDGSTYYNQYTYEYDSKGRVIKATLFDSGTNLSEEVFTCTYEE